MATFETLGGTLSISDDEIELTGNRLRRLKNQLITNRGVLALILSALLLAVIISIGKPSYARWVALIIGGAVSILAIKLGITRLKHGSPTKRIKIEQVSKAFVKQPPLYSPVLFLEHTKPDGSEETAMIFLPHRWMNAEASIEEILTTLDQHGVPTEEFVD